MKKIFYLVSVLFIISSCQVFRDLGIYNVPPSYADSYENYHHKPFIKNLNTPELFKVNLVSDKKTYESNEDIKIYAVIKNISNKDSIFVYTPNLSLGTSMRVVNSEGTVFPYKGMRIYLNEVVVVDNYGRKLNTIIESGIPIAEKDSVTFEIYHFSHSYGSSPVKSHFFSRLCDFPLELPIGEYNISISQQHESFDEMNGPYNSKLNSDVLKIIIVPPIGLNLEAKNDLLTIDNLIIKKADEDIVKSEIQKFIKRYPNSIYIKEMKTFIEDFESSIKFIYSHS